MHKRGLSGHSGVDKTKALVEECYYWPTIDKDIKKRIQHFIICQHAKDKSQDIRFYTPLSIPKTP